MAIAPGSQVELVMNMQVQGMLMINAWQYNVLAVPGNVTPVQIAEAWWNHVKAGYRGLAAILFGDVFRSVRIRELNNNVGAYAEFAVPPAERVGTRANPAGADAMPPFAAVGVRLVVGSRLTRPGQKRFPFLVESDQSNGALGAHVNPLIQALLNVMDDTIILGTPAALTELQPVVTAKDAQGFVTASQPWTGYIINQNITTQNTRKYGRGA